MASRKGLQKAVVVKEGTTESCGVTKGTTESCGRQGRDYRKLRSSRNLRDYIVSCGRQTSKSVACKGTAWRIRIPHSAFAIQYSIMTAVLFHSVSEQAKMTTLGVSFFAIPDDITAVVKRVGRHALADRCLRAGEGPFVVYLLKYHPL